MERLHEFVLLLPVVTTVISAFFCTVLFTRYRRKGGGKHLLWWGLGMATYGLGTFTEAWTSLLGWNPTIFRAWYVAGAFLGGYPLAQGSLYLLAQRRPGATRFAEISARVIPALLAIAAVLVFLSPLDLAQAEPHRLSGKVLAWTWLRWISPWVNIYSACFLIGGAIVSALRFRRDPQERHRYLGNILIAVGALLPGIGGSLTRAGYVEALYVTELAGLILIYLGYRKCLAKDANAAAKPLAAGGRAVAAAVALVLATAIASPAFADDAPANAATDKSGAQTAAGDSTDAKEKPADSFFATTTVTALGRETDTFEIATPVTVVPIKEIELRQPQNPAQLLLDQPGVDVNGVGPNQQRPVIRGQRGLRVLFLEDGLRLNNARRQTDFGEISGLSDLDAAAAVEVVRGPASVLYGSDAIGGVLNVITRHAHPRDGHAVGGSVEARGMSAGNGWRGAASVDVLQNAFDFQLGGSYRDAGNYKAPSGDFGKIHLADSVTVRDSGDRDRSLWGTVGYALNERHSLRLRLSDYHAENTGFGLVDPTLLEANPVTDIRILYPDQKFQRAVLTYNGGGLSNPASDSLEVKLYHQRNQRVLVNNIGIDIGPIAPGFPHSGVQADTRNFTDVKTDGVRAEAIKLFGERNTLTYGFETFRDDSHNTDFSTTTTSIRFPFPPFLVQQVSTDGIANAPNAQNSSWGVFAQDEIAAWDRLTVTGGLRYQETKTKAKSTPGWDVNGLDFSGNKLVGAVTATWQIMPELNALASYGTAFRAPSIIERLFNGPTPEGTGFQILNPSLNAESSKNWDLGLKYRRRDAFMELVAFRSDIDNGVVQYFLSPQEIAALPADVRAEIAQSHAQFVVQQRNADRLRYEGIELSLGYRFASGVTLGGNFTHLNGKRFDPTNPPTGDTYSRKLVAYARWEPQSGRFWMEYRVRNNGAKKADLDPNEPAPPVGTQLPSFTVHSIAGGVTLFERDGVRHTVQFEVANLTDQLYAEFSNASFFRPEAGRSVTASYRLRF